MNRFRAAAPPLVLAGVVLATAVPPNFLLQLGAGLAIFAGFAASVAVARTAPLIAFLALTAAGLAEAAHLPAAVPWGILLVAGFCAGSGIRGSVGRPPCGRRSIEVSFRACATLWALAALAGVIEARSLWAWKRGLALRVVNFYGTLDIRAISGTVVSLGAVLSGWFLYTIARDLPRQARSRMLSGALAGAAVSAFASVGQAAGVLVDPRSGYWRTIGRLQGLCGDPNALGIASALAFSAALSALWRGRARPLPVIAVAVASGAGVILSGSRSALLLVGVAFLVDAAALWRRPSRRIRPVVVLAAVVAIGVLVVAAHRRGTAGQRFFEFFNPNLPLSYRASARPALWAAAWQGFRSDPIAGIGWNGYWWNVPNIAAASGSSLVTQDNPGNFYLQILCETGIAGTILVAVFAGIVVRRAWRSARAPTARASAGPALLGLLAALAGGSHLLAPEVAALFFLLLSSLPDPTRLRRGRAATAGRLLVGALACAAWAVLAIRTDNADYAFRYSDRIGFWNAESSPEGSFRWMSARAAVRQAAGKTRAVDVIWPGPGDDTLNFRFGSGAAVELQFSPGDRRSLRLDGGSGGTVFRISSRRWLRPASTNDSDDARALSVRWREVPPG